MDRFEFAGRIDNVRIYSSALSPAEIVTDMKRSIGDESQALLEIPPSSVASRRDSKDSSWPCKPWQQVVEVDRTMAGVIVALGLLVAVAAMGFWPRRTVWGPALVVSLAAGLALLTVPEFALPSETRWMIPWLTLAGGISAAVAVRPSRNVS